MDYQKLMQSFKSGDYSPVYLLHGEEPFFIDQISNYISENTLGEAEKAFNLIVLYGKESNARSVVDHARQFPMMSNMRVIIIKEAQEMKSLEELASYLEQPNPTTVLVICYKYRKIDGRTRFSKIAKEKAIVFESRRIYDNQLAPWIEGFAQGKGFKMNPVAIMTLIEYLGNDLTKISNELEKLFLNIKPGSEIQQADVFDNIGISKDFNVFELQKALGKMDHDKAMRIVKHFMANLKSNPLVLVIPVLYNYFSRLYVVSSMIHAREQAIAKALGLKSTWFVKEYVAAARNYSTQNIERILGMLHVFDMRSKGIRARSIPDGELLRQLIESILYVKELTGVSGE
jgi:DNA polymerase-3 subunit delta